MVCAVPAMIVIELRADNSLKNSFCLRGCRFISIDSIPGKKVLSGSDNLHRQ
jgi:hypothetical protein